MSDELAQRRHVIEITRQWLGTPYVNEGRIKGACADCTFFAKVFEEAGLIPYVEIPHYSPQAHLNRASGIYMGLVQRYAKRELQESEVQIADVVLYHVGRQFSHGGVIVTPGWPCIIHADMNLKKVCFSPHGNGGFLGSRERRFFSFW